MTYRLYKGTVTIRLDVLARNPYEASLQMRRIYPHNHTNFDENNLRREALTAIDVNVHTRGYEFPKE